MLKRERGGMSREQGWRGEQCCRGSGKREKSNVGVGLEGEESKVGKNLQRNRTKPKMQWRGPRAGTRF